MEDTENATEREAMLQKAADIMPVMFRTEFIARCPDIVELHRGTFCIVVHSLPVLTMMLQ